MAGKTRPSLLHKTLKNVETSNLSITDKECIYEVFKNFVSVVKCEKCKHWHNKVFDPIIEKNIGECHCPQWENDYFWYETTETDFCSYGERK